MNSVLQEKYHCPLCAFDSVQPGSCPIHQVSLLEGHVWREFKKNALAGNAKKTSGKLPGLLGRVLMVLAVLAFGFAAMKIAQETMNRPEVVIPGE